MKAYHKELLAHAADAAAVFAATGCANIKTQKNCFCFLLMTVGFKGWTVGVVKMRITKDNLAMLICQRNTTEKKTKKEVRSLSSYKSIKHNLCWASQHLPVITIIQLLKHFLLLFNITTYLLIYVQDENI